MIRWSLFILGLCSCCFIGACSSRSLFAKKITTKASYETCAAISSEDMKYVNEFNKKAVEEMHAGNCQKAELLLKKALSIDPNCGKAHYNLGVLYAWQPNYYLAALEFEKAYHLMQDEQSKDALIALGCHPSDDAPVKPQVEMPAPGVRNGNPPIPTPTLAPSIPDAPPAPQTYNVLPLPQYGSSYPQYGSPLPPYGSPYPQ